MNAIAYAQLYPFFCGVALTILMVRWWMKRNRFRWHEVERVIRLNK